MCKAKIALCSEIPTKHSTQSERHVECLNAKPGGYVKKLLGFKRLRQPERLLQVSWNHVRSKNNNARPKFHKLFKFLPILLIADSKATKIDFNKLHILARPSKYAFNMI